MKTLKSIKAVNNIKHLKLKMKVVCGVRKGKVTGNDSYGNLKVLFEDSWRSELVDPAWNISYLKDGKIIQSFNEDGEIT